MPLPGRLHEGGVGHEARPQGVACGGEDCDEDVVVMIRMAIRMVMRRKIFEDPIVKLLLWY